MLCIPRMKHTELYDSTMLLSASPPGKAPSLHDSARGSPEPGCIPSGTSNGFQQLVQDINTILGPCNGIDSAGVDIGELKFCMRDYVSNEAEWEPYAFADYSRAYTRNLVDRGNGKANLVSLLANAIRLPSCSKLILHDSSSLYGHLAKALPFTTTPTPTAS